MQVYAPNGTALRGDLLTRVVLRTDLTPIPATVEIKARVTTETRAALVEGQDVLVGPEQLGMRLVKVRDNSSEAAVQGDRQVSFINAIGVLTSCWAVGEVLQRSIIREGTTFGEIYRSIGATARAGADFTVPGFACFIGMAPSFEIARVLQEEAAAVYIEGGRLQFRRLDELVQASAKLTLPADRSEEINTSFLERRAVPFVLTTTDDGAALSGRRETARGFVYRPRADQRIVSNMSKALIQRRKVRESLSTGVNAGARVDIAGKPHVVITAAHVVEQQDEETGQGGDQFTQLWLGELSK